MLLLYHDFPANVIVQIPMHLLSLIYLNAFCNEKSMLKIFYIKGIKKIHSPVFFRIKYAGRKLFLYDPEYLLRAI